MTSWKAETEIAKWAKQMHRVPKALRDAAEAANSKSQAEHAKRLYRATPLGDGQDHIRNTIQTVDGDPNLLEKVVRIGSAALKYALSLEFGHKTASGKIVPGTRFFRSVRTIMRKKHRNRMRKALRDTMKQVFP